MAYTKRALGTSDSEAAESEPSEIYEVERILAQDEDNGEVLYLVKWKGYNDRECTWEPADSFEERATIIEWQIQFAKGDTLDDEQVAQLQQRMDDFKAEQFEMETREPEARQARETKRQKLLPSTASTNKLTTPARTSSPSKPQLKSATKPTSQAGPTTPGSSTPLPSQHRNSTNAGEKFRNLRHMANAQKKAALRPEVVPQMTNLIAPADLGHREPCHFLPPAANPRQDSPLFVDSSSQSPTCHLDATQARIGDPYARHASQSPPVRAIEDAHDLSISQPKLVSKKSGREWSFEEVLVQLSLGEHGIGDVKLAGFPSWLRRLLVDLKVDNDLVLHFQQDFVLNRKEFSNLAADWPLPVRAYGEVHPFEDTKIACDSLADYFGQHDVAALWAHPDPAVSSIVLILHLSSLPRWRQTTYVPLTSKMPRLLVGVRNRAPKDQLAPPMVSPHAMRPTTTIMIPVDKCSLPETEAAAAQNFAVPPANSIIKPELFPHASATRSNTSVTEGVLTVASRTHDQPSGNGGAEIFTRGLVLLLTEATMRQPAITRDILIWFEKNSRNKSKNWKIMVRPNVRAWLQHCALCAENDEIQRQLVDILVLLHQLSSIVDVTAIDAAEKLQGVKDSLSAASPTSDDFIIPLPQLPTYDVSPSADTSPTAVSSRDEILLRHFVGWSATNKVDHGGFVVIEEQGRSSRDLSICENAPHIVFRSAEEFSSNQLKKKRGLPTKKQR